MSHPTSATGANARLFADTLKLTPYWLEDAPATPALSEAPPGTVDVAIIGAGYTGLNAAIQAARGGRSVVVIEKGDMAAGCSAKNGGQISTCIKPSLADLTKLYGPERATAIRAEGVAALNWIEAFVKEEGIDCDFRRSGRFFAAHTPEEYEALAATAERRQKEEGVEAFAVTRSEQRAELGTDFYYGGVVNPTYAALQPAKYLRGLLDVALKSGAQVVANCAATGVTRTGAGFRVMTERGEVEARDLVVATNGYTSGITPWLRRRVIPIGSYVIATEELPTETIDRLFPTDRMACDTRRVVYYYRASPDRKRIVFGGRVAARETDPLISGPKLHAEMTRIFPEMADVKISHSWVGFVAYSFDELMHIGSQDGLYYAAGYCGSGVSMASYLGMKLGRKLLGAEDGRTAFDGLTFQTRPGYGGEPWFLPAAVAWYRWRDEREIRRAARQASPTRAMEAAE